MLNMTTPVAHPERRLAVAHAPRLARESLATLFALDERLAQIALGAKEPMLGLVRLVWWRDALAALDGGPPPAEPLLHAAAALRPDRISGADLARIAEGWESTLDDPELGEEAAESHARARGGQLFRLAGRAIGLEDARLDAAGRGWALADLARQQDSPARMAALLDRARDPLEEATRTAWPHPLRALGMLAILAREDVRRGHGAIRPPASRGRLLRLMAHRWTGR